MLAQLLPRHLRPIHRSLLLASLADRSASHSHHCSRTLLLCSAGPRLRLPAPAPGAPFAPMKQSSINRFFAGGKPPKAAEDDAAKEAEPSNKAAAAKASKAEQGDATRREEVVSRCAPLLDVL